MVLLVSFTLKHIILQEERKRHSKPKQRIRWSYIIHTLSDNQFKRMYRMSKEYFNLLCERIIASISESEFKAENYIDSLYQGK